MAYLSNIILGHITKTSGFEGAVVVKLERNFIENIPLLESVFLEIEGRPVPFFISYYEYNGSDILKMELDGYDSIDKVNEFKGCRVFLTTLNPEAEEEESFGDITGYSVLTTQKELLGSIREVVKNPGQWLLDIKSPPGREILIPLHEDFIVRIDDAEKIIIMEIPDGLIDLN